MPRKKTLRQRKNKRSREEWEQYKKEKYPDGYILPAKQNDLFEKFYSGIGLVSEEEMPNFLETLRKPLPITFRITGSRKQAQELLKIVQGQYFKNIVDTEQTTGVKMEPKCLSWYPDQLAWQLDFTKRELKQSEASKKLHRFLISETESGNISRQEAVSMLPPLLMDIKSHHKILDMCAAPGSKTAQLIEYLHSDESEPVPEGFVIANDMDNKRCYLMTHQVKRIQSANCIIINHDARALPNLRIYSEDPKERIIKYDRVLCDVPCSGDGTLRKNPDIWARWGVGIAFNLHKIQKSVLQRGLELLAVGGKLVYSTCSMNPVENEAVIMELLRKCDGAVELVDVSDQLQNLKYHKGLYSWKIMDKDGIWYDTFEQTPALFKRNFDATMFAPLLPQAQDVKLERCIRILPHYQDTGGFFIAVLHKKEELPWVAARTPKESTDCSNTKSTQGASASGEPPVSMETNNATPGDQERGQFGESATASGDTPVSMETNNASPGDQAGDQSAGAMQTTQNQSENDPECSEPPSKIPRTEQKTAVKLRGYKEDPFHFCQADDPVWPPVQKFYQISEDFNVEQLMYRNKKRILYYVSKKVASIVKWNDTKVKFINLGVKCFNNAPSPIVPDCDFRLGQEGLHVIQHFIKGRRVTMSKQDVITVLSEENPFICKLSQKAQEEVYQLDPGSVIFEFKPSGSDSEPNCHIPFCGWRGKTSVRSFVGRDERAHYLRLFGVELADIQIRVAKEKDQKDTPSSQESPAALSGDEEEMKQWTEKEAPRSIEEEENYAEGSGSDESREANQKDPACVRLEVGSAEGGDNTDLEKSKESSDVDSGKKDDAAEPVNAENKMDGNTQAGGEEVVKGSGKEGIK